MIDCLLASVCKIFSAFFFSDKTLEDAVCTPLRRHWLMSEMAHSLSMPGLRRVLGNADEVFDCGERLASKQARGRQALHCIAFVEGVQLAFWKGRAFGLAWRIRTRALNYHAHKVHITHTDFTQLSVELPFETDRKAGRHGAQAASRTSGLYFWIPFVESKAHFSVTHAHASRVLSRVSLASHFGVGTLAWPKAAGLKLGLDDEWAIGNAGMPNHLYPMDKKCVSCTWFPGQ